MSVTPTPSTTSDQISLYYDALVMQFSPHTDDTTEQGSRSADPRPGASGNPTGTNQHTHANGMNSPSKHAGDEARQKTPSLRSLPIEPDGQDKQTSGIKTIFGRAGGTMGRKESVRTTRSTHTSTGRTSAFSEGAPLMGPNAEPDVDESLFARSAKAERSLSQKQKDRIMTEEKKESKKFSKLLKMESTTEKVALASALKSLTALQNLHKAAIKREASAGVSHARALSAAQKAESRFQEEKGRTTELRARAEARCAEERARWEGKEGEVLAQQERLDSAREAVKEMEVRIAECAREVERLRIIKATDEREREAKIIELAGQK